MNAEQAFEKYAKEHLLEPNNEYGSAYTIARYWFMLGWDSRHETMRDAIANRPKEQGVKTLADIMREYMETYPEDKQ